MNEIVVNKSPFDQFTLVHGTAGVLARHVGLSFGVTLALGFAWDYIVEPYFKQSNPDWFPFPSQDAPSHALIDAVTPAVTWMAYDVYLRGERR